MRVEFRFNSVHRGLHDEEAAQLVGWLDDSVASRRLGDRILDALQQRRELWLSESERRTILAALESRELCQRTGLAALRDALRIAVQTLGEDDRTDA